MTSESGEDSLDEEDFAAVFSAGEETPAKGAPETTTETISAELFSPHGARRSPTPTLESSMLPRSAPSDDEATITTRGTLAREEESEDRDDGSLGGTAGRADDGSLGTLTPPRHPRGDDSSLATTARDHRDGDDDDDDDDDDTIDSGFRESSEGPQAAAAPPDTADARASMAIDALEAEAAKIAASLADGARGAPGAQAASPTEAEKAAVLAAGGVSVEMLTALEKELDALEFSVAALEKAASGDAGYADAMATCGRVAEVVDAFASAHRATLDELSAPPLPLWSAPGVRLVLPDHLRPPKTPLEALRSHLAATVDALKLRLRAAHGKLKLKAKPRSGLLRAFGAAALSPPRSPAPPLDTLTPPKSDVRSP